MKYILTILVGLIYLQSSSQTLPSSRSVDWTLAGLRDTTTSGFALIDMQAQGVNGNGTVPNDSIVSSVLSSISGPGAILDFPLGNFLFNNTIELPSNVIIRGQGADVTTFTMDLGGTGHSFRIEGSSPSLDTTYITTPAVKDSNFLVIHDTTLFSVGDWFKIVQNDADLVTSLWAENSVGQVARINSISNNKIILDSPLRMDVDTARAPYIIRINPVKNTGIECLKIHRLDDTAPMLGCNIYYLYAVNCWVRGVESENCTNAHVKATRCSNLSVSKSYFHHGFSYGSDGRAYGLMIQQTTNECLFEDNVFEHLRHSMLLQTGANGNVFAYNYSFDPFWNPIPNNAAGDIVLHGNYPYANLFEQNICQNIVIDNSHGPNGPHNTFLRNRAELYGIYFSAANSPDQNLLGNEITNTGFPFSLVNYTIQGSGHFIHGNNNKGTIDPAGTNALPDSSYFYTQKPDFIPLGQWAGIGTPSMMGSTTIPAYDRFQSGNIFDNPCNNFSSAIENILNSKSDISIFPNPVQSVLTIQSSRFVNQITIINSMGQEVYSSSDIGFLKTINIENWTTGVYFIKVNYSDNKFIMKAVIKTGTH